MFCNRCGRQVPDESEFCPACGADLREARRVISPPGTTPLDPGILDAETVVGPRAIAEIVAGTVLADRYEVRELLGSGGMGAVYRAYDRLLQEEIALKVLHPELVSSGTAIERFVREAQVSRKLSHPNIVRVHDIGQAGELRYLTMELLRGRSLRAHLEEVKARGERLPVPEAREILEQVLSALSYAHRLTVHRDVKPENVFLEEQSEGGFRVKLLDFGIAKVLDRETFTRTSTSLGTAWYVAPEQMADGGEVDARADLYSVGVLAYELLTGELPMGTFALPSKMRDDVDAAWDAWIRQAMERRPEDRFPSAAQMLEALRRAEGQESWRRRQLRMTRAAFDQALDRGRVGEARHRLGELGALGATKDELASLAKRLEQEEARRRERREAVRAELEKAIEREPLGGAERLLEELRSLGGDPAEISRFRSRLQDAQFAAMERVGKLLQEVRRGREREEVREAIEKALGEGSLDEARKLLVRLKELGGEEDGISELEARVVKAERARGRRWLFGLLLVAVLVTAPVGRWLWRGYMERRARLADLAAFQEKLRHRPGERRVIRIRGEDFAFRWIPPGEDEIGSPPTEPCRGDDERQWTAVITTGFWMGETEVTRRQWYAVMRTPRDKRLACRDCPMGNVSWGDAQMFIKRLNHLVSGGGFRLPWEAEWEYACRAGVDGPFNVTCFDFSWENCRGRVPCLDRIGWYGGNSRERVGSGTEVCIEHPVGQLEPNAWGLYDCHGNVREWCGDLYGSYPAGRKVNWHGPPTGWRRVVRGGAWNDAPRHVRLASRYRYLPDHRARINGLRLVRVVP